MWESKKRNRKSHTPSSQTARAHSSSLSERVSDTHTVPPGIPHSRLDGPHELGDQPSWSTPSLALRCRTLPIVTLGSNRGDQASRQTARSAGDPTQLSASPHMPQRNPHSNPKLRLRSPPHFNFMDQPTRVEGLASRHFPDARRAPHNYRPRNARLGTCDRSLWLGTCVPPCRERPVPAES